MYSTMERFVNIAVEKEVRDKIKEKKGVMTYTKFFREKLIEA